ncbi:MAG: xanthine dehydrogenase family protein molybdopterin-binding subunit [Alphaproteobacteria bacterium]
MRKYGFGQSVRRSEDPRLLTGGAKFTADLVWPRQAYLWFVRSPHAHAELRGVRVDEAKRAPGVLAVLAGADTRADGLGRMRPTDTLTNRDGSTPFSPSRPILAEDRVRYVGEPVAVVVAESESAARDAAELVEVDYEALPAVADVRDAARDGAVQIWPDAPGNRAIDWHMGDEAATEREFARAARIVSVELVNNRISGFPMEPLAIAGEYHPAEGRYTLHTPSQGVHSFRVGIASHVLGVPEHALRVITPEVGGAFGVREAYLAEHAIVLWAARRVARAVRWTASRGETLLADPQARDHWTRAELALDEAGKFLAIRVHTLGNLGAYISAHGRTVPTLTYAQGMTGLYAFEAAHVRVEAMFTNTMMTDAYRGAGRPEALYVVERLVDAAAAELGIAREELRRRNFIPPEAMPYRSALGEVFDSGRFAETMDKAFVLAEMNGLDARRAQARARGRTLGFGISTYVKINGGSANELAEIRFEAGGGCTILIGTQANGQGHATVYAQYLADTLGIPFESIRLVQGDSDQVPYGKGTGGSSALSVGGSALVGAAERIILAGKRVAGHLIEASAADLEFAGGRYVVAGTDRAVTMTEVVKAAFQAGPWSPDTGFGLAERALYLPRGKTFANGCHLCEVELDSDTGALTILRYSIVDDVGRVLNPMIVEGQVHGGLVQGLGQALIEHCVYDRESGQFLTASLMDYGLPRADQFPAFTLAFNEIPCTTNPLGVKGVGEAGTTGGTPALVSAALDALRPHGVARIDMPLAPERLWRAIEDAKR